MIVKVIDRRAMDAEWGYGPHRFITRTVEIADTCPVCGGPRGEIYWQQMAEDGCYTQVNRWDNPCGHLDLYVDVIEEADRLRQQNAPRCSK